jgi:hypothetical protein
LLRAFDALYAERFRGNTGTAINQLIRSLQIAKTSRLIFDAWAPSAIVSTSDLWPFEYQFAFEATSRNIPSVVIQHGSLVYFYWPFIASLYILWGDESFREMCALGAPADRLAVAGMPASDKTFRWLSETGVAERNPGKNPVCLILSHTHARSMEPELYENYKSFLNELIPSTPFVRWRVKLHPAESRTFYEDMNPDVVGKLEFYPSATKLEDALEEADVVTTLFSTAALEAMMKRRPVIVSIVSPRMAEPALLPQVKGAFRVHTPEEFGRELQLLISNPEHRNRRLAFQSASLNQYFANQGHASQAIVDLLEEHIKRSNY